MYNNDPKYTDPPGAGLASLLASRGQGGDSMVVHMAPEEVSGLQQLALSMGAKESDLYNPLTGQPQFSFLKKILPQIIGAIIPSVPGVGQFAKTIGFGNEALGSALIVGGATGLVEGDLKKGLMAGLGAYSGASIAGGLKAAAGVGAPATEQAAGQVVTQAPPTISGSNAAMRAAAGIDTSKIPTMESMRPGAITVPPVRAADIVQTVTPRQTPTEFLSTMGRGVKNIFTTPEGASKFMEGLGGGYKSPIGQTLSRYATFSGAMLPFTEEPKAFPTGGAGGDEIVYIPGKYDPSNTSVFQAQGQYYRRTPQGLIPYNPWASAPKGRGFADGGAVAEDPKVLATRSYIEELNRRARNPYGDTASSGIGGGLSAFGPQYLPPATSGGTGADTGAVQQPGVGDIVGGIAANYLINKGIGTGIDYLRDKFGNKQPEGQIQDSLEGVDLSTLPATTAALSQLNPLNVPPREFNVDVEEVPDVEPPATTVEPPVTPPATSSVPFTTGSLAALSAASPFMDVSPLPPTRTSVEPVSYEGEEMVVREDMTPAETAQTAQAATTPATSAIPYSPILSAVNPFAAAAPSAMPVVGEPLYDTLGNVSGFKYPDGTIEPVEGYTREPGQLDADLQTKTQVGGDVSAPLSSYLSSASSLGAGLAGLANAGKAASIAIELPVYDALGNLVGFSSSAPGAASAVGSAATGAGGAATGAGTAGAEAAGAGAGTSTLTGKVIPGLQAALGLYEAYKGIEQGKEGRAALGGFGAGAGIATLAGAAPGFGALAAAGPIGLAAAAIAAIGASLVNTKEFGDVALRNYWNAVEKEGRGLGSAPPKELAQGFINFYRTNKNNFAGQQAYGRTGNEDFIYDMTQVINNAVNSGKVGKDVDPATMYKEVVQPWLNSMGSGPQDENARKIQDFMMTDLIYNFMQGRPISNAQVKGDKNYKIVSEKPVYAGTPFDLNRTIGGQPVPEDIAKQMYRDFNVRQEDLNSWAMSNPYPRMQALGQMPVTTSPYAAPVEEPVYAQPMPEQEIISPYVPVEAPPFDPDRYISPELAAPVGNLTPIPEEPVYAQPMPGQEVISPFGNLTPVSEEPYYAPALNEPTVAYEDPAYYQRALARFEEEQRQADQQAALEAEQAARYAPEPSYADYYNPYADVLPYERMYRFAGGGAIGDDFNFGFAGGGSPEYKAGGKLLNGPGDGMSDSIPAVIRGKGVQRAALADGEFVIPADVVSHLGNGSTKAGAKKLYDMMARIREARTGKTRQAPAVKANRYMPA